KSTYMVVDCGGESSGALCGSTFVDQRFVSFVKTLIGDTAMELLKVNHPSQYHFMIQEFCSNVKIPFTGEKASYKPYQFSILRRTSDEFVYQATGVERLHTISDKWSFKLEFDTVLSFFDPVIDEIIELIEAQLSSVVDLSAIFLVGGFSESLYLQKRIKRAIKGRVDNFIVPISPELSILNGACKYGLNMNVVQSRILKWTYGVKNHRDWKQGDPPSRNTRGLIYVFQSIATKGDEVFMEQKFRHKIFSIPGQDIMDIEIYCTKKNGAVYCDEPEMVYLGEVNVQLFDNSLGIPLCISMHFGQMELIATVTNEENGYMYKKAFQFYVEFFPYYI
ncbi:3982_t:CDS:2, partial [Funneliformis mosseae]